MTMYRLPVDVWQYIFGFAVEFRNDWNNIRVSSKSFQTMIDDKNTLRYMKTYVNFTGLCPNVITCNPTYFQNIYAGKRFDCNSLDVFIHMRSLYMHEVIQSGEFMISSPILNNLTTFDISGCCIGVDGVPMSAIQHLMNCTDIYLSGTPFSDMSVFVDMSSLINLDISYSNVVDINTFPPNLKSLTARGCVHLVINAVSESLTSLHISECMFINSFSCKELFPNLVTIVADNTTFHGNNICGNLFGSQLRIMSVADTDLTRGNVKNICGIKSLLELNLSGCSLTNEDIMGLSRCEQLRVIRFGYSEEQRKCIYYFHDSKSLVEMHLDCTHYINVVDMAICSILGNMCIYSSYEYDNSADNKYIYTIANKIASFL